MPCFEVETKFAWKPEHHRLLRSNSPQRPFAAYFRNFLKFRDTYFDTQERLSNAGLWVRKRQYLQASGKESPGCVFWEAKKALPKSSFNSSAFEESTDTSKILEAVRRHYPAAKGPEDNFGLEQLCQFVTERSEYHVEDRFSRYEDGENTAYIVYEGRKKCTKFTMVLDETDFGHRVGELELMAEDPVFARAEIDGFVAKHSSFFDVINVKGKMSAYFEKEMPGRLKTKDCTESFSTQGGFTDTDAVDLLPELASSQTVDPQSFKDKLQSPKNILAVSSSLLSTPLSSVPPSSRSSE